MLRSAEIHPWFSKICSIGRDLVSPPLWQCSIVMFIFYLFGQGLGLTIVLCTLGVLNCTNLLAVDSDLQVSDVVHHGNLR